MNRTILLAIALLAGWPSLGCAASVWPFVSGTGSYRAIVIEGEIVAGDTETFLRIVREHGGRIGSVYVYSSGGDFFEALRLGRAIRALELTVTVPSRNSQGGPDCDWPFEGLPKPRDSRNCNAASAAFFIYLGGVHRSGRYLAAHRPTFSGPQLRTLSQAQAATEVARMLDSARAYMSDMGAPLHIQDRVLSTQPAQVWVIEESVIRQFLMGPIPARAEWLKAKCEQLRPTERESLTRIRRLIVDRRTLSAADETEYSRLSALAGEESTCEIAASHEALLEAFERFFGEAGGDDATSHLFARWPEATRFLGRDFHQLMAEERFDESQAGPVSFLRRDATSNAPLVLLSDSQERPKVVASVSLLSTPEPSPGFIQQALAALVEAWGATLTADEEARRWTWLKSSYYAELYLDSPSVEGRHLVLRISQRH